MSEPVQSEPFHILMESLKQGGFVAESNRLAQVLNGTWTTSSELIGELGLALLEIRKNRKSFSPAERLLLKRCMREVRKAWPGFGIFSWLPFRH